MAHVRLNFLHPRVVVLYGRDLEVATKRSSKMAHQSGRFSSSELQDALHRQLPDAASHNIEHAMVSCASDGVIHIVEAGVVQFSQEELAINRFHGWLGRTVLADKRANGLQLVSDFCDHVLHCSLPNRPAPVAASRPQVQEKEPKIS